MKIVWTMRHKNCFLSKTFYLRASQNILKDLKILYSRAFKNIEIQIFFNLGELILSRKSWKSSILVHFRRSIFKIFFNHGELILWRKSWKSFILVHFRTSIFKIFFNHGELLLLKNSSKSFILMHFRILKIKIFSKYSLFHKVFLDMSVDEGRGVWSLRCQDMKLKLETKVKAKAKLKSRIFPRSKAKVSQSKGWRLKLWCYTVMVL